MHRTNKTSSHNSQRRPVFICNLFAMNTNSAVTSPPVARGGLTADRTHNRGLDLSLVRPATYDTISSNEAEAWEQAERGGGGGSEGADIPPLALCVC